MHGTLNATAGIAIMVIDGGFENTVHYLIDNKDSIKVFFNPDNKSNVTKDCLWT